MNTKQQIEPSADGGAPKRRVVRRVIRRVPKGSLSSAGKQTAEPVSNLEPVVAKPAIVAPQIPVQVEGDTRSDDGQATPITPAVAESSEPASDPKSMILEQLVARHPRTVAGQQSQLTQSTSSLTPIVAHAPAPVVETTLDNTPAGMSREGRSAIESVWPYLAAAKQHGSPTETHESAQDEFDDAETPHSYFSWLPWFMGALVLIGITFGGVSYFSGADVVVTPKSDGRAIDADVLAEKDSDISRALPLSVMTLKESVTSSVKVAVKTTPSASSAASGKITVFNTQPAAQTLIKGTRFQPVGGKIYKIRDRITVPAAKGAVPGSIEADVYAESPGPSYNLPPKTHFNLPALLNTERYKKVYAENVQAIGGGSDGSKQVASSDDVNTAIDALRMQVETKLRSRIDRELTKKQIAFPSLYRFTFDEPKVGASSADGLTEMTITGYLNAPTFIIDDLTASLAKSSLGVAYKGEPVLAEGLTKLDVALSEKDKDADYIKDKSMTFHFSGNVKFTWIVDVDAFRKILLNVERGSFESVVRGIPSIRNAEASLRPMWKQYFPSSGEQIKITVVQ